MPPTLRSGRATRSTPNKTPDSESAVDLSSPATEPASVSRPPAPASDHQPAPKRQRATRTQPAVDTQNEAGPSSRVAKGKMAATAAVAAPAPDAASKEAFKASQQPPWKKQRGVKRVMAEFHAMSKHPGTQISHLEMVDDNALKW